MQEALDFVLFHINQKPITLGNLLSFLAVLISFWVFGRVVIKKWLVRTMLRMRIEQGTTYNLSRLAYYLFVLLGFLVGFQFIGIDMSNIVVVFGFLSVGIGFGLQNLTSNFISGLIILFERPIRVGDRITIGNQEGDVQEINIRSTTIKSLDNIAIIVPNSDFISSQVVNWSYGDPKVRLNLDVGVSYSSDLDLVLNTLKEVALNHPDVLETPQPEVLFLSFGDSSWNLQLRVWTGDPKKIWTLRSEINCDMVRAFARHEIEIPFPQRDVHVRSRCDQAREL
jgi:small-conductance mechanosensitive channel